jgi:hypothetical protein
MTSRQKSCNDVITIPQTKGTCWLNAILMSILYSQYSRNLLLTNNTLDKKKDKISKILNQLLKNNYIKYEMYESYFTYMRPEIILKYLNIFPTVEKYKQVITNGYRSILVVHKFIKKLNKTSINLDLYKGKLYGHLNLIVENMSSFKDTNIMFDEIRLLSVNTKITKTDFSTNPDYIIVNPTREFDINTRYTYQELLFYLYKIWNKENLLEKFKLDTYDIKTKGITTLENEIVYNGDKYILDSCLLSNFNTNPLGGHAITGITCNNNRFVYNGWVRNVQNKEKKLSLKQLPCELMKLDWDIHNPIPFCLNLTMCKLDPADLDKKDDVCFSFDRGPRHLIYVKVKNLDQTIDMYQNFSSSEPLTLPSSSKLSIKEEKYLKQKRKIKKILTKKIENKKKEEAKKKKEEKKKVKEEAKKKKEEAKKVKEENKKVKEEAKKVKEEAKKKKEENIVKTDKCNDVITIPQSNNVGSCWFNAVLMSILYSQYSKNMLLTNNTLDKKKDKISKILNQFLKHNYIKNKMHEDYFKYMRPEIILKYLNFFATKEEYKKSLTGYHFNFIIHKFIKKLNKTSINLDLYNGKLYGHLNLITEQLKKFDTYSQIYDDAIIILEKLKLDKTDFTTNPDYIIVNPILQYFNKYKYQTSYQDILYHTFKVVNKEFLFDDFNINKYNIKTQGIKTLKNEIVYNGDKYILDSCLIGNYNVSSIGGHAITGITCNNNRFVYNGWLRDIYSKNKKKWFPIKSLPCELMKLDWNINKPDEFCLNPKECKLDKININKIKNDLCFSFDKGPRSLIYVKVKNLDKNLDIYQNFSSSETLTLPSTSKLSIKNAYEITQKRKLKEKLSKKPKKKEEKKLKKRKYNW